MWFFRHRTLLLTIIFGLSIVCGLTIAHSNSRYRGDSDSLVFPDSVKLKCGESGCPLNKRFATDNNLVKSLQLAKEINSMDSAEDFLKLLHVEPGTVAASGLTSRIGETGERSNAERATPAKCMPELQPVSLKEEGDTSTIYFPPCTRVKRCGGCCTHSLLSCQPIASEIRNFEVLVASVERSNGPNYRGKRIVPLEEHTKCQCDCRIKPEHCTEKQSYIPEECRCACNNVDETEKCVRSNDTKIWNPELCTCHCREDLECSTGFYFDQNTCRCRQVSLSRNWFAPTRGAEYAFGQTQKPNVPPIIIALDAADLRRKPKEDPEY